MENGSFVLTLACPDTLGIVSAVSTWLFKRRCNILESAQFGDANTGRFAMRIRFRAEHEHPSVAQLERDFDDIRLRFDMTCNLRQYELPPRILIMVSRQDHCLHDLLYRYRIGELNVDVRGVISNHTAVAESVAAHRLRFMHWPVDERSRPRWDEKFLELIDDEKIDFVVLARYMRILSRDVCSRLPARIINIHHSFLPGFKGAQPYVQAYERGVKVIGATAHYVTPDLDEGPIIEQDVVRVDHAMSAAALAAVGRDIEKLVLARAVRYQTEQRIVLNGTKTIVFR